MLLTCLRVSFARLTGAFLMRVFSVCLLWLWLCLSLVSGNRSVQNGCFLPESRDYASWLLFLLAHLGAFSGVLLWNIRSGLLASLHLLLMCLCMVSPDVSFLNPSVCVWAVCGHVLHCR